MRKQHSEHHGSIEMSGVHENWQAKSKITDCILQYYGIVLLEQIEQKGVLAQLSSPQLISALASSYGFDQRILTAVFKLIAHTTGTLALSDDGLTVARTSAFASKFNLEFPLLKYVSGYGPCVNNICEILDDPKSGGARVDRPALAQAFALVQSEIPKFFLEILDRHDVTRILDLGCGQGLFLRAFAEHKNNLTGIGIDLNRHSIAIARQKSSAHGLSNRLRFVCEDALLFDQCIAAEELRRIDCVFCKDLLNEFFHEGPDSVARCLKKIVTTFPGKPIIVVDYLSSKSTENNIDPRLRIHDFVQLVSGQGIPPSEYSHWCEVYELAGLAVEEHYDIPSDGYDMFLDVLVTSS